MTAQEARAITDKNKEFPDGIKYILDQIKHQAEGKKDEFYIRVLPEKCKAWLQGNGYRVEKGIYTFYAGSKPQDAVKITW